MLPSAEVYCYQHAIILTPKMRGGEISENENEETNDSEDIESGTDLEDNNQDGSLDNGESEDSNNDSSSENDDDVSAQVACSYDVTVIAQVYRNSASITYITANTGSNANYFSFYWEDNGKSVEMPSDKLTLNNSGDYDPDKGTAVAAYIHYKRVDKSWFVTFNRYIKIVPYSQYGIFGLSTSNSFSNNSYQTVYSQYYAYGNSSHALTFSSSRPSSYTNQFSGTFYVKLREKHTITYNLNGGKLNNSTKEISYTSYSGLSLPTPSGTPTRTGYTFAGWDINTGYVGAQDVTYYAQWTPIKYTFTLNMTANYTTAPSITISASGCTVTNNLTSSSRSATIKHDYSTTAITITVSVSGNYAFRKEGGNYSSSVSWTWTPNSNRTVIASNFVCYQRYTVTYNGNGNTGGTVPSAQSFYYGGGVTIATNSLTRDNYLPNGWNTSSNGTGTNYSKDSTYKTNANLTLYSKWKANFYVDVNMYIDGASFPSGKDGFTFSIKYGSTTSNNLKDYYQRVSEGTSITLNNFKAPAGYSYARVEYLGKSSSNTSISFTMPANGVSVLIYYSANTYTVDFEGNNVVTYPYSTGYYSTTASWQQSVSQNIRTATATINSSSGTGGPFFNCSALTSGQQYKWTIEVRASRNITLYYMGFEQGGLLSSVRLTTSWQTFTHTFTTNSSSIHGFIFYSNNWQAGDVLYVRNCAVRPASSVTADNAVGSLTVTYNGTYANLPTPKRTGYTFNGWYLNSNLTGSAITASSIVTNAGNHTLYAKWTVNSYYLDLNMNINGSSYGTGRSGFTVDLYINNSLSRDNATDYYQQVNYGTSIVVNDIKAPTGYKYVKTEYTGGSSTGSSVSFNMPANNASITIYYVSNVYTATLKYQNGNSDTNLYLKYGVGWYRDSSCTQSVTSVSVPSKTGFTFGGFYNDANTSGTQTINESGNILASNTFAVSAMTWYAKWTAKNQAQYDEELGKWYVEMGEYPQSYADITWTNAIGDGTYSSVEFSYDKKTNIITLNGRTLTLSPILYVHGLTFKEGERYTITREVLGGSATIENGGSPGTSFAVEVITRNSLNSPSVRNVDDTGVSNNTSVRTLTINSAAAAEGDGFKFWLWTNNTVVVFNNYQLRVTINYDNILDSADKEVARTITNPADTSTTLPIYEISTQVGDMPAGSEFCLYNNKWYKVEPVRYYLEGDAGSLIEETTFTGSNYISLDKNYKYTDKITVSVWAYMDDWSEFDGYKMKLISCTESGGWSFGSDVFPNYVTIVVCDYGYGYRYAVTNVTWDSLSSGWHHFAMTFDGNNMRAFLDGELKNTVAFTGGRLAYNNSNKIFVGAEAGGGTAPDLTNCDLFIGKIKGVHILNEALDESEVKALMNGGYYSGYGTESSNVTAVTEKVVFASVWNDDYFGHDSNGNGLGYKDSDLWRTYINNYFRNANLQSALDSGYTAHTNNKFQYNVYNDLDGSYNEMKYLTNAAGPVASTREIDAVFGEGNYEAEFTDFVADILGNTLMYWTRDVGSELNNAECITRYGSVIQAKMQNLLGIRVTANVRTFGCV